MESSDLSGVTADVDGNAVTFDTATGAATEAVDQLGGGSNSTITVQVAAGTTVDRITYMCE